MSHEDEVIRRRDFQNFNQDGPSFNFRRTALDCISPRRQGPVDAPILSCHILLDILTYTKNRLRTTSKGQR